PARGRGGLRRRRTGAERRSAHRAVARRAGALRRRNGVSLPRRSRGLRRRARASSLRAPLHLARRLPHARAGRGDGCGAAHRSADAWRPRSAGDPVARRALAGARLMARKTSFYYSFLVLPPEQRRAIVAVWDFCRAVDDAVDEAPVVAPGGDALPAGRAAVAFWREELARAFDGREPATAQGRRLQPFVRQFDLPRQAFEDVIDGVAMDLDTTSYQTFADLFEYCRRVASAVGLICIRIFGCRDDHAREYAVSLGVALQLTNILRDIPDDLARGRVYLPLEDLAAHGCTVDDLAKGVVTDPVRRLLAFECARAREFYQRAILARPDEDRRRLVAAEIMRAVYFETLRRIERNGYDVFKGRVRVKRPMQAFIAVRQLIQ